MATQAFRPEDPSNELAEEVVDFRKRRALNEGMTRLLAAAFIAALALAGVALAASSAMTPKQMQAELVSPATVFYTADKSGGNEYGSRLPAGNLTNPICRGLGKPAKGAYLVFSCSETFHDASGVSSVTMWVRPYSAAVVCQTSISVGACPPPPPAHPLAGDPRVCDAPAFAYSHCVYGAARSAMSAKLRATGNTTQANLACLATTAFVYRCTWYQGVGTVTFVQGKTAWSTTVTSSS